MKMKVKLIKYSIFYVRVPDTRILKIQYTTLIDNKNVRYQLFKNLKDLKT